ncbi:MAG: oligosaccharide flippase family protein [Candidatus Coatesbacteria bacterium]|nr:oligosaccharide flippase family protein [Candidatus Coatesbacteria bacterium]
MTERIIENSARMTLLQVCGIVANSALYFILARMLSTSDYGVASCTVFPALALLRTGIFGALMFGTAKVIAANPQAIGSCVSVSRKAYAIVGGVLVIVFVCFGGIIAGLLRDTSLGPYVQMIALAVLPVAAFVHFQATLIGLKDFRSAMHLGMLFQVLKLLLTVALVFVGMRIFGVILGFAVSCVVSLLVFRRKTDPSAGDRVITLSYYMSTVSGIFITFAVAVAQRYVNLWNLKRIVFDNQTVAYYSVASQLASIPAFIFTGVMIALWPAVSGLANTLDLSLAKEHLGKSLKYTMIGLLPISAILAAVPNYAIRLAFGREYEVAASVLPILVVGLVLLSFQSVVMSAMVALNKVKTTTAIMGGAAIAAFLIGNSLIPRLGIMGAAATEVVGYLLSSALIAVVSWRMLGKFASFAEAGKLTACTIVLFLTVRAFAFLGSWVIPVIIVALGLYFLALIVLGVLQADGMRAVLSRMKAKG